MRCFLLIDDPQLTEFVCAELEGDNATIDDSTLADVVIVDDELAELEQRLNMVAQTARHIEVLLLVRVQGAEDRLLPRVTDVLLKPLQKHAVALTLRMLQRRRARTTTREELLALAVEGTADVVELSSPGAVLEYVNPAFVRTLGYSHEEAVGHTPAALFRSKMHDPEYFREIDRTLTAGKTWRGLLISRAKDGRHVHLDSTISPVINAQGETTHIVAVRRDMTQRIAAETELRATNEALIRARDAALDASRVKGQFLANMSHELRTPLNAIIGYSEMLAEDAETLDHPTFSSDVGRILSASAHLLKLINDVLDLSKIEAGHLDINPESVSLISLVEGAIATIKPMAAGRGNRLRVEGNLDFDEITCDVTKLRQILLNLLSNANKFTESGKITVRLRRDEASLGVRRDLFVIEVADTGIGMSDAAQVFLFQPFAQADASTTRKYGGTGLGLTISQRFCEAMGGHISVTSEPGKGSTFIVHLPRFVSSRPGISRSIYPTGAVHTVLVIGDDQSARTLLIRTLGNDGFRVESEENGEAGLLAARSVRPDVIVLDVLMPTMDALSVLRALKDDELTQPIPVIMLLTEEQADVDSSSGATDYLIKPVDPRYLLRVVRSRIA